MTDAKVKESLIEIFCKEYQSLWLINIASMSMKIFSFDESKSIPDSIEIVSDMESYEEARRWYVANNVVAGNRDKMMQQTELSNVLEKTANGNQYYVEYGRINRGEINYNQLCYDRVINDEGKTEYILLGFRDIDVRKRAEIDEITGLLTRQAFMEKAEWLIKNNPEEQFDVIISDIMDFKKINDIYGIKTADKILRWNGDYLQQIVSDDILVGRYGGDQMVIFGTHQNIIEASAVIGGDNYTNAERENGLPEIQIKFGMYHNISHKASVISSCDKAHMALNSIKNQFGKVYALYDEKLIDVVEKKRRIEDSMYSSLKNGDFKVYYQPKHDVCTGKLVGAEALVRWIHPEYGFMSPADFIPLFEQNGFIVENDKYVWERTCENLKKWQNKGIKVVPISVNASKLTMLEDGIVNNMQIPVDKNGISPSQLHVEITETLMTEDVEDLVAKLNGMREAGFGIELDDFGAGYSSINVLSTLPLDVVKLDMSFMKQFGDEKRAKVLAACIDLAKELGFKTVSEGVELKEQNDALGKLGVDMIQGYLYSKPLPEEAFEEYLRKYV